MIRVEFLPEFLDGRTCASIGRLERLRGPLRDFGIDWGCVPDRADVVWTNQQQVRHKSDRPLIMHEVRDSAAVNWSARQWLSHRNVLVSVKGALYRPRKLVNAPHYESSYHGSVIYCAAPDTDRPEPPPASPEPVLGEADLAKLRLGYNWLFHPHLDPLAADGEIHIRRDIDVFFAGTLKYARWHIAWHRRRAVDVLERLPGRVVAGRGRVFPEAEYRRCLMRSRVVVSPWGFGETCIRDVEALLAGCVLVKPETRFCDTWPDYHRAANCLWCRPDFSDLPEVVAGALDRRTELDAARLATASWLRRLRSERNLARRIAAIVKDALGPG